MKLNSSRDTAPHSKVAIVLWRIISLGFVAIAVFLLSPWSHHMFVDGAARPVISRWNMQLLSIPFFRVVAAVLLLFLALVFWSFPRDGKPRFHGRWYWD